MPDHYRRFFRTHLRFALVMVAVALLTGICFQESGRKVHISEAVPVGAHLEYILGLALVHGHTFLLGVLVPLALTWILYLGLNLGFQPLPPLALQATTGLYVPGALAVILLMLVKSYHFILGVRHGVTSYDTLNQSFMGGGHALRAGVYGATHAVMAAGLAVFAVSFWRSMNREGH